MNTLFTKLLLALMLLVSQTAVAIHDIECLDEKHEQICKIYATQDHAATKNVVSVFIESGALSLDPQGSISSILSLNASTHYQSRAPPKSI